MQPDSTAYASVAGCSSGAYCAGAVGLWQCVWREQHSRAAISEHTMIQYVAQLCTQCASIDQRWSLQSMDSYNAVWGILDSANCSSCCCCSHSKTTNRQPKLSANASGIAARYACTLSVQ